MLTLLPTIIVTAVIFRLKTRKVNSFSFFHNVKSVHLIIAVLLLLSLYIVCCYSSTAQRFWLLFFFPAYFCSAAASSSSSYFYFYSIEILIALYYTEPLVYPLRTYCYRWNTSMHSYLYDIFSLLFFRFLFYFLLFEWRTTAKKKEKQQKRKNNVIGFFHCTSKSLINIMWENDLLTLLYCYLCDLWRNIIK